MATRLYLPASGTPPLSSLAYNSNWELSTNAVRLPCATSKSNTALANKVETWPSATTQQWVWMQYQSPTMQTGYSWTATDTVSMVIRCLEGNAACDSHLAYVVRVVSQDGSTVRGVIGLYHATSTEFATSAATRIHSARTNGATAFTSYPGDRIIIEIGLHGVTPSTSYTNTMRYGDPSGTSDFALTAGLTTDLCPWVELSRDVVFGTPIHVLGVSDGSHSHVADGGPFSLTDDLESYTTGELGGQGSWITLNAAMNIADTSGDNRAVGSGQYNECAARRTDTSFVNDQYAEVTVDVAASTAGNGCGVAVRCSGTGTSSAYYFGYYGGVVFYVRPSNTWTEIQGGGDTWANGDVIRLEIIGTTLRAYRNGSLDTSLSGGTGEIDVSSIITTYSALASGIPGICAYSNDSYIDDFVAGNLAGGITLTEEEPSGATLVVADGDHLHLAESVTLSQVHSLIVANAIHDHIAESPSVQILFTLVIADTSHEHLTESVTIGVNIALNVADTSHEHSAESVTILQIHFVALQNASHDHSAENIVLLQIHSISVQDCSHSHTGEAVTLDQSYYLLLQDTAHSHIAENVTLSQNYIILSQDASHAHEAESPIVLQQHTVNTLACTHGHTADQVEIQQVHILSTLDSAHEHSAESVSLHITYTFVPQDTVHSHSAEAVQISVIYTLIGADALHTHIAETVELSVLGALAVDSGNHVHQAESVELQVLGQLNAGFCTHDHIAESVIILQVHNIDTANCSISHEAEEPILQIYTGLVVASGQHTHATDEVSLIQNHNLSTPDSNIANYADVVTLLQLHTVSINDTSHIHIAESIELQVSLLLVLEDCLHDHLCDTVDIDQIRILSTADCSHELFGDYISLVGGTSPFYTNFREVTPHHKQNEVVGGINANGEIYCRPCIDLHKKPWKSFKLITRKHTYTYLYNCMICGHRLSSERNKIKIGG